MASKLLRRDGCARSGPLLACPVLDVARKMGMTRARITKVEHAELIGGVTLKSMQVMAEAMGWRFVSAINPSSGRVGDLITPQARKKAYKSCRHFQQAHGTRKPETARRQDCPGSRMTDPRDCAGKAKRFLEQQMIENMQYPDGATPLDPKLLSAPVERGYDRAASVAASPRTLIASTLFPIGNPSSPPKTTKARFGLMSSRAILNPFSSLGARDRLISTAQVP